MIYVASSWRNPVYPAVVEALKAAGLPHYDFRHPAPGNDGFHWWQTTGETERVDHLTECTADVYLRMIDHPIALHGFSLDFEAMQACDTCVLVLPCGKSAHLELGWFVGQCRRTAILLEDPMQPELMYRMVDHISPSLLDLLGWLGVKD